MRPSRLRRVIIGGVLPPILLASVLTGCERRPVGSKRSDADPAVARVNDNLLHRHEFASMLPEDYQMTLTLEERRAYLDRWIATELLYEEAVKEKVGPSDEIQARLEQYKKDLVADLLVQQVLKQKAVVSQAEVRAYYDAHINEYTREYRVSHILTNTREDAEKVRELLKTRPFDWVERRYSIDKHTGPGGDLGFLSKGNMIPAFEAVVFKMQVGEVSDIIESEFGYHIIKLTDERESRGKLEFEDAAAEISRTLLLEKRAAVYDSLITALRKRADIDILDPELGLVDPPPGDTLLGGGTMVDTAGTDVDVDTEE